MHKGWMKGCRQETANIAEQQEEGRRIDECERRGLLSMIKWHRRAEEAASSEGARAACK